MRTYNLKQRVYLFLAGTVIPALVYCFGLTWRVKYVNAEAENAGPPLVWAFWHARLLPLVYYFRNRGIVVLVSRSFDGEITSRVLHRMGFSTIRGSTSRGAMQSLREVVNELKKDSYVAFTPDGPKGPSEVAQIGASAAARLGNAPLVAVTTASSKNWRLNTWDKFIIPKPFAKVEIRQSEPIIPGRRCVDEISEDLQKALDEVTTLAEDSVTKGVSQ